MQRVEYPEFSVEIFMLDTNAMDSHPKNLGTYAKALNPTRFRIQELWVQGYRLDPDPNLARFAIRL